MARHWFDEGAGIAETEPHIAMLSVGDRGLSAL